MKLSTSGILSLIGALLVLVGMFIPAVYGLTATGINSNDKITLMEFDLGFVVLIAAVLAIVFAIIEKLNNWAWVFGLVSILLGMVSLLHVLEILNNLYQTTPMVKSFIHFGPGIFVVLAGGLGITISGFLINDIKIQKLTGGVSVLALIIIAVLTANTYSNKENSQVQDTTQNIILSADEPSTKGTTNNTMNVGPMFPLDNFTVNLLSDSGRHYLKVQMNLELDGEEVVAELESKTAVIRTVVIRLLSSKHLEEVSTAKGKDYLKEQIINQLNLRLRDGNIRNVHFTEFSVL